MNAIDSIINLFLKHTKDTWAKNQYKTHITRKGLAILYGNFA